MNTGEELSYNLYGNTTPLPPIMCERDRASLREIQGYIQTELQKVGCTTPGPDDRRYWIYSTAFSMLISKVMVYKDILSDIKREYEDCITALKNGQREAKFLEVKIKTMSSLPTTIHGYLRRQKELEERLEILNADNRRLENILNELVKSDEDKNSDSEEIVTDTSANNIEKLEKRPIPGLPVVDWTNEKTLKTAVENLDGVLNELQKQKKTSYVPKEKREEVWIEFREKMQEKEELAEECNKLRNRHRILKMANEAAMEFKELGLYKKGESLTEYIKMKIKNYSMRRESSLLSDSPNAGFEDDDPSREKEAEMILEYIEKFNELFYDGEYAKAATHAAVSPIGVLRALETMLRFKEASEGYNDSPSPLFLFAEAFMHSSDAQNNFADEEMSYECIHCALNENRPDMVLHWLSQGRWIKSCKKVADRLRQYAYDFTQHKTPCLTAAQKMYSEIGDCKVLAAALLYELGQVAGMLDYTTTERFSRESYFEVINECMDENLVWILSRTTAEEYSGDEENQEYINYQSPLPIPLSYSLVSICSQGEAGKSIAVHLLEDIFDGQKIDKVNADPQDGPMVASDLSKIIYTDGEGSFDNEDLVKLRWKTLAKECENQNKIDLAIDIRSALVVRNAIRKAISVIAEDEKEQFDYYT